MHNPKPFDYAAFIDELKPLIERGRKFDDSDRSHSSQTYRAWRLELLDLIHRVNRLRYDINCGVEGRWFQVMSYATTSAREQRQAFDRDLEDTLTELELVVSRFDKYGDPRAKSIALAGPGNPAVTHPTPAKSETLVAPEKVTFAWLWAHVPLKLFGMLLVSYGLVFSAGLTVASTKVGKTIISWFTSETVPTAAAERPSSMLAPAGTEKSRK